MRRPRALLLVALAGLAGLAVGENAAAQRAAEPRPWKAFPHGWTLRTKSGTFQTTLGEQELAKMAARIAEITPAYQKHFGTKLKPGWTFVVLADRQEYAKFAKETTRGREGVQGQCFRDKRFVTVCNSKRYGWLTTLSHEYAHAFYDCSGPIWLREGVASLVEVAEIESGGSGTRKRPQTVMRIPVNPPRLRGLRIHQRGGHYTSIQDLVRGAKEPDGYGYSYEHGWSLHYFLYQRDASRYRAFLKAVRNKSGRDLSAEVSKVFGLDLDELDELWREFTAKLKA